MKASKSRSLVARLGTAGAAGLFIAIGLFAILSNVVAVPFEAGPTYKPVPIEFTDVFRSPPPTAKPPPPPKIERPPVTEVPRIPASNDDWSTDFDRAGPPVGHDIDPVNPVPGSRQGPGILLGGNDRDVTETVRIRPVYPVRAEIQGIEGWVRVQFTITQAGTVRDARVVAASPEGVFEEAALSAIARWRYNPRILDGVPVERVGMQTLIQFELAD